MSQDSDSPAKALLDLRRRLHDLPTSHASRRAFVGGPTSLFGVSQATLYRALAGQFRPRGLRRADRGQPRKLIRPELAR